MGVKRVLRGRNRGVIGLVCVGLSVGVADAGPGDRIGSIPIQVSTTPVAHYGHPRVAANGAGDFLVVWDGVMGRRFSRDGIPFGDETRISPLPPPNARDREPGVVMHEDGSFVVAWRRDYTSFSEDSILAQRFNSSGEPVGDLINVNSPSNPAATPVNNGSLTSIAMDGAGNFVVAWKTVDPVTGQSSLLAQRYDHGDEQQGATIEIQAPLDDPTLQINDLVVGMRASGDFVAVWTQYRDGFIRRKDRPCCVRGRAFTAEGVALGDSFDVSGTGPGVAKGSLAIAMGQYGDYVVAFVRRDPGEVPTPIGVYVRRFNPESVPRAANTLVSRWPGSYRDEISAAMNRRRGEFVISWVANQLPDDRQASLHTRIFDRYGVPVTADERRFDERKLFEVPGTVGPRLTSAAIDDEGVSVVAWSALRMGASQIFVQRFAAIRDGRLACQDIISTFEGTDGPDVLTGTSAQDVMHGAGGRDILRGGGGDDIICGGWGDDLIFGNEGNDLLRGDGGDDVLDGGAGKDSCNGGNHSIADRAVNCEKTGEVP